MLLKTPKNSEMDWNDLANKYEVPLTFLLQQAAYLYDQQFSQVRAQLRRVGASKSSAVSPVPGTESTGETMVRTTSTGQQQTLSRAPLGRDSAIPETEDGAYQTDAGCAGAPSISRNTSATVAAQLQSGYVPKGSPKPAKAELHRRSMSPLTKVSRPSAAINNRASAASPPSIVSSDGEDSSSDSNLPMQSRLLRRPPRRILSSDDEEEVDDSPTFLPFKDPDRAAPRKQASAATLRDSPSQNPRRRNSNEKTHLSQTSDSSASSTAQHHPLSHRDPKHGRVGSAGVGTAPVPRRTAELAGRSPQSTGSGQTPGRGSDGAPSMGSSYSDLDGE